MQDATATRSSWRSYGLFENLPNRVAAFKLKHMIFTITGREVRAAAGSARGQAVVHAMLETGWRRRDRLTAGVVHSRRTRMSRIGTLESPHCGAVVRGGKQVDAKLARGL